MVASLASGKTALYSDRVTGGIEWIIDALGCREGVLGDRRAIVELLDEIVDQADLHVLRAADHVFEEPGGVTAMYLLAESHLTIHTFPEVGTATLNLYCCRPRSPLDWSALLARTLGARRVTVRELPRGGAPLTGDADENAAR
jgi:S-adenosylmethionine decarboxylase